MTNSKSMAVCILFSATTLSGCVHGDGLASAGNMSTAIADEAILYSQARKNATNGIIFSNILEAQDRGIAGHNTVTGVQSAPTSTSGIETLISPLGLGNPKSPLQASTSTLTRGATKSGTFSVNPVASTLDQGSGVLYSPIQASVFKNYWTSNWPKDVLLSVLVEAYEDPASAKNRNPNQIATNFLPNNGKKPNVILKHITAHFGTLSNISLEQDKTIGADKPEDCRAVNGAKLIELTTALGTEVTTSSDVLKTISKIYGGELSAKGVSDFHICKPKEKPKGITLYPKDRLVDGLRPKPLKINLRSFDEAVYFVGETMRYGRSYLYKNSSDYDIKYEEAIKKPLMIATQNGNKNDYAVWTHHRGRRFYTVPRLGPRELSAKDRSQTTITMLRNILELNQSKTFLKAPDNQFLVR